MVPMRKLLLALIAATALTAAPAEAHYTSTVSGSTATFTGDSTGDALVLDQTGGLLRHNRFGLDTGFNSQFDFDTATAGDQTLSATTGATHVNVSGGAGADSLTAGTAASPASGMKAQVSFDGGNDADSLTIDDSASSTAQTFYYQAALLGIDLGGSWSYVQVENAAVHLGTGPDNANLYSLAPGVTNSFDAGAGDDALVVGSSGGKTLTGILGSATLDGGAGTDSLLFGDSGQIGRHTYRIDSNTFTRDEMGTVTFGGVESAGLTSSGGADNIFKKGSFPFTFITGPGADYVSSEDSVADSVDCGDANDLVFGDLLDSVMSNCESVDRFDTSPPPQPEPQPEPQPQPTPQTPPADTKPPGVAVTLPKKVTRKLLVKGLRVTVTPDEASAVSVEERAAAARVHLAGRSYNLTLAQASAPLGSGARTFTLKAPRKLLGKAKRFGVRFVITAVDAAGNRTVVTRTRTIRR